MGVFPAFGLILSFLLFAVSAEEDVILITPPAGEVIPPCIADGYLGSYGRPLQQVFVLPLECALGSRGFLDFLNDSKDFVPFSPSEGERTLVWLQEAGVDDIVRGTADSFDARLDRALKYATTELAYLIRNGEDGFLDRQIVFGPRGRGTLESKPGLEVLHRSPSSALISVDSLHLSHLDIILPPFIVPIALPSKPQPLVPVPAIAIKRIYALLKSLRFNPEIASILSTFSLPSMESDIRHLTGEDGLGILSRHSFSKGARVAADWIQSKFEETGALCRQSPFLSGYAPNVICRYAGTSNTTALVLLSAHYDSRGSFGSTRAPGANDDGSGITHLLAIARAIKENGIQFRSNVELVAFAGEEQGLLGSAAYARELKALDANITLMIQADMLAFHSPSEPLQIGFPDLIGLPEAAWLVANVSNIYSPELTIGITPACCSDHQSFNNQGFPSTQVFERAGPILDPMYHNSGDVSDRVGYDLQQVRSIAKATFATVLVAAGFDGKRDP
ncbi:hypothetical protein BS47DRAFT_1350717 [Hydnum rufescens UP504]|uniref:Peptide hydrolase n=1 Tax=Hydnum rufescens UP504 TaxID=1448309 RepID=A0A9P6ALR7_9AGAM|nr:hypothetical protein BS47DRAFT_1350717 [Hydnum rufescens UP504]